MRIGFVSEDWVTAGNRLIPGGCTYYRCMLPMNAAGPYARVGKLAFTAAGGFGVRVNGEQAVFGFDQVVFKMVMHKWIPRQMEIAQALGQRIIVDIDDHFDGLHDDNRAKALTDPERNRATNREHLRRIVELADTVTVSTPFLADYYADKARDVRLVRNGINPNQFTVRPVRNEKPVIGWAGAMGWRSSDIDTLRSWLPAFLEEHDLLFLHAGDDPEQPRFADRAGIPLERMLLSSMRPLPSYHEMLQFDIGLVPLNDIPFNHAKSAIKGLEYAAAGIPFVAQALPEYERIHDMGVGRVATTPEDWVRELTALLDYKTRKREARWNRELVMRDHTIRNTAHDWVSAFEDWDKTLPIRTSTIAYRDSI